MDVNEMPYLDRRMYGHHPETAEVVQENDVDGSFVQPVAGIPADLLAIVHEPRSVDEIQPQVEKPVDVEKVTEENPNSRFRLLNLPVKKPGVCFVCRSDGSDERQFVDFGKTVEWYGVVYICTFCVAEVAKILNYVPSGELEDLSGLHIEISQKNCEIETLKEQLNASWVLLRNCHCHNNDSDDSVPDPVPLDEGTATDSVEAPDDSDESSDVEESGDVSEASVDDDGESEPEPEKPKRARRGSSNS